VVRKGRSRLRTQDAGPSAVKCWIRNIKLKRGVSPGKLKKSPKGERVRIGTGTSAAQPAPNVDSTHKRSRRQRGQGLNQSCWGGTTCATQIEGRNSGERMEVGKRQSSGRRYRTRVPKAWGRRARTIPHDKKCSSNRSERRGPHVKRKQRALGRGDPRFEGCDSNWGRNKKIKRGPNQLKKNREGNTAHNQKPRKT